MQLSEDEIIQKYAKQSGPCGPNTFLPYEYERTFVSSG